MAPVLTMWTICKNPRDYPGKWVLRAHDVVRGSSQPRPDCIVADSLEEIRKHVPPFLYCQPRQDGDEPQIYETWF
jgi:hypothetical protein